MRGPRQIKNEYKKKFWGKKRRKRRVKKRKVTPGHVQRLAYAERKGEEDNLTTREGEEILSMRTGFGRKWGRIN